MNFEICNSTSLVSQLREILPQSQLFLVYQALIESHLRYGNLIWDHLPEKLCSLQKIQDRAFYLIESAPIKDKMPSKRLSLEKIITYDRGIMVHKVLRKRCPENLKGKFTRRNQISKYKTRRMRDLQILKHGENSQREVFRT